jgi:serine/threonine protein kinase
MSESGSNVVRESESGEYPRSFGNYLLLTSLARGGMGEVFLAKSGGIAGIEKHCVVKTLRGNYTMDREYVTRFIDEARVVVQLHHRNICQIYDVGRVGKQYYLAMEYIVGRDLRTIMQRARDLSRPFARPLVLHILAEMLEALDYAHRIVDPITGEALRVVHRDVSPQNVMLNFEGEVKLIDFGLAQSAKKVEKTQPHVVMGKMAYMSPEQARGDPVDGRADQFAAAVLCYELLSGERYYEGLSFDQIWSMAGRGGHEPRMWATLDEPLRDILGRALRPNANDRYATCADFKDDLVSYQVKTAQLALSRDTRSFLSDLFGDEAQAHRDMLARFQNVRMLSRESDLKSADESQSFSSASDHESILSGAPVIDETARKTQEPRDSNGSKKSRPIAPLRHDEKTVSTVLISNPSMSGRVPPNEEHTYVESAPVPELTLIADRPTRQSDDATVFDTREEADKTAPSSDAKNEATEAVRVAPRPSRPLAPTVILDLPPEERAEPQKRSVLPLIAGLGVATVLLAVIVVLALRPSDDPKVRVAAESVPPSRPTESAPIVAEARPSAVPAPTENTVVEPEKAEGEVAVVNDAAAAPKGDDTATAPAGVDEAHDDAAPRHEDAPRKAEGERRPIRKPKPPPRESAKEAASTALPSAEPPKPKIKLKTPGPASAAPVLQLTWLMQNCVNLGNPCVARLDKQVRDVNRTLEATQANAELEKLKGPLSKCVAACQAAAAD